MMTVRLQRTAVTAPGQAPAAMAFAAEITTYLVEQIGLSASWGFVIGGTYGKMCWYSDYADMAEMEALWQRLTLDEGYNELVNRGELLFVPGSGEDQVVMMP